MDQNAELQSLEKGITVGEMVKKDFGKIAVFKKYGIDYCCKGNKTFEDACNEKDLTTDELMNAFKALEADQDQELSTKSIDYNNMELDQLIDHIVEKHHSYLRENIPIIVKNGQDVVKAHGKNHAETVQAIDHFMQLSDELLLHMGKEENILFPYIKQLTEASKIGKEITPPFGSVANPINMMKAEHESAGNELEQIRELTNAFDLPSDACATFWLTYKMLKEFEDDLMFHIHLENNILFSKAIALEKEQKTG